MDSDPYSFEGLAATFAREREQQQPPPPPSSSFQQIGSNFYDDDDEDIEEFEDDVFQPSEGMMQSQHAGGRSWGRGGGGAFGGGGRGVDLGRTEMNYPSPLHPPSQSQRPLFRSSALALPPSRQALPGFSQSTSSSSQAKGFPIRPFPRASQQQQQHQYQPQHPPPPPPPSQRYRQQQLASGSRVYGAAAGGYETQGQEESEDEFEMAFGDGSDLLALENEVFNSPHPQNRQSTSNYAPSQQSFGDQYGTQRNAPRRPLASQASQNEHSSRQQAKGNRLVPVSSLPDRYRSLFKFGCFNAVQSQCFETAMKTDDNLVVSAPTGSGKTVLFELTIIRLLETGNDGKAVYIAPTKALCSERSKDWNMKFSGIGVRCTELTGDTDWGTSSFKDLDEARLIVTTPEKWDSMTRWQNPSRGNSKFLADVSLFLIDEVHILHEKRGSSLEVIVSRMKSFDRSIRFVALSATVPNVDDVGRWLRGPEPEFYEAGGSKAMQSSEDVSKLGSAKVYKFGEEYRPCMLKRIIVPYPRKSGGNAFQAAKALEFKVFSLLTQHGKNKPGLIFCPTRNGTISCAEQLVKDYQTASERREKLPWRNTSQPVGAFTDEKLQKIVPFGVAFHHGGLSIDDRRKVEAAFLSGALKMICSTSTLAVGVNLPAHTVVILGTKMFAGGTGMTDYTDLDLIQMIGRAGRPQFDREGLAIILCESGQEQRYEQLTGGGTILESSLHENLTEHLNSEIALHTIDSLDKAQRWLKDSFLYIRVLQNPRFYSKQLGDASKSSLSPSQALEKFVADAVKNLRETGLIAAPGMDDGEGDDGDASTSLHATASGDVMSRNFIKYNTMKRLMKIPDRATLRELLEVLCEADEFEEVRLRGPERSAYKKLGQHDSIRFPVKEVKMTKDKVFVVIQATCGGIPFSEFETGGQPAMEALVIFRHAVRISKSILDIGLERESGSIVKHGLEILRTMNAKAWEGRGSVLFRQLEKLGDKAIKIFAQNNIKTFDDLASDSMRIERLLSKKAPFGAQLVEVIKGFPKFSLDVQEKSISSDGGISPVAVELECTMSVAVGKNFKMKGFRSITVSSLVITSDFSLVDFRRSNIKNFKKPQKYTVTAHLRKPSESITVYVSCGSSPSLFSSSPTRLDSLLSLSGNEIIGVGAFATYHPPEIAPSEYPVPDLRPKRQAEGGGFEPMMDMEDEDRSRPPTRSAEEMDDAEEQAPAKKKRGPKPADFDQAPIQLENGKWKCNHTCRDKSKCSHMCCREGMAHPPTKKLSRAASKETPAAAASPSKPFSLTKSTGTAIAFSSSSKAFGRPSNVPNSPTKSFRVKPFHPSTKKEEFEDIISDDDELPEGDAMFDVRPNPTQDEFDDDNSSALYGDEELERIMANLPDRAFKGSKGKGKGKGKQKVERDPTPDFTWSQPEANDDELQEMNFASQSSEEEVIDLRGKSSSRPAMPSTKSKLAKLAYVPPLVESPAPPPLPRSNRPPPRANLDSEPLFLPKSTASSSPKWNAAPLPKKDVAVGKKVEPEDEDEDEDEETLLFVPETSRTIVASSSPNSQVVASPVVKPSIIKSATPVATAPLESEGDSSDEEDDTMKWLLAGGVKIVD
ncbi:hypothetical protein BDY24DRAFT_437990 [Mrakia frigida]|uniref:DNA helicase n=1 Tax=Mrakia frigida TaxID=29902 RepID=UPI003FCC1F01